MVPLRFSEKGALVYLYRPEKLKRDLADSKALSILKDRGYPADSAELCVAELLLRLNSGSGFPHEIGLFLGYPPDDVEGFIYKGADKAKYTGLWKVYGDLDSALAKFAAYKKCAAVYREAFDKNISFEKLIVSC